ncbi:MAG: two-component system response regulator [Caulobacter sp.]|nr:two-component system response regulator [Caulobacter sp.]
MGTIFNLSRAVVMVVDDNAFSLRLTTQTLLGFGIKTRHLCADAQSAVDILKTGPVDLLIVDCDMPGPDGYDLVSWLRRSNLDPNAFTPTLMISGHTRASQVAKARDCGANFIVTRPITPAILLERILWMARDPRPFIQAGEYVGPDRRFNEPDLPPGQVERRADRLRGKSIFGDEDEGSKEGES